jgi:uncharacterized surface protein with fasciclin (FAS1) repeats
MNPQMQTALPSDIAAAAERAGMFSAFLSAATKANLFAYLTGPGPITVFAPTDAAFAHFPEKTWASFERDQGTLLRNVLTCHFAQGLITADQFTGKNVSVKTVQGANFMIEGEGGDRPRIAGAFITEPDIVAANGVLHGIDGVLWFAASVRPTRDRDRDRDRDRKRAGGR